MWGHVADVASESSLTGCIDVSEKCQCKTGSFLRIIPLHKFPFFRISEKMLTARTVFGVRIRKTRGFLDQPRTQLPEVVVTKMGGLPLTMRQSNVARNAIPFTGETQNYVKSWSVRCVFVHIEQAKKEKGPLRAFGKASFGVLIIQHTPNKWASFLEAPLPLGNRRSILVARDQPEDHMANPFAASKN
ncbi:hypothetical protein HZH68_002853 [Vespula germanica]|uniref:Uncharacterized protein n=1 Tax=Vespula germanica TaxID=30212 RepID=A0A834NN19_VESGE|nr:hypothetical protein HZH68_002853 [Vespula germanica]